MILYYGADELRFAKGVVWTADMENLQAADAGRFV